MKIIQSWNNDSWQKVIYCSTITSTSTNYQVLQDCSHTNNTKLGQSQYLSEFVHRAMLPAGRL